jgi:dephospho-CoA kinase
MQKQNTSYAIKEAALIFESGSHKQLDYVIGVKAPAELRIRRTMQRNHITREQVLARMSRQMDEEEKMNLCDFIIVNDEQQMLIPQVLALHSRLLSLAGSK